MKIRRKMRVKISIDPVYWGYECTDIQAREYACRLARNVEIRFPGIEAVVGITPGQGIQWLACPDTPEYEGIKLSVVEWIDRNWIQAIGV